MDQYNIQLAGRAVAQYEDLLARATAAGKQDEFERRYGELVRVISDPGWALQVGRPIGQTNLPGGFYRQWQYHFRISTEFAEEASCGII